MSTTKPPTDWQALYLIVSSYKGLWYSDNAGLYRAAQCIKGLFFTRQRPQDHLKVTTRLQQDYSKIERRDYGKITARLKH